MKIIHIIPGTGDVFYCQNCMRDKELVMALRKQGHDVVLVPMYLPLFAEGEAFGAEQIPVFYGAVSVYLAQVVPGFQLVAPWFRRWLDHPAMLKKVSRKAGTTSARGLEAMTLSVLRGEYGRQKQELDRLMDWLTSRERPDIIHLSSALLLGLAGRIRRELKVPVFCSLQDEDSWIDSMDPAAAGQAWALMSEKARDITAFTPVSQYYSALMQSKLIGVPGDRFHVVPIGISTGSYGEAHWKPDRPVIGYLSRMSESMGLGTLVDAFVLIHHRGRVKSPMLRITGGSTPEDQPFLEAVKRRLAAVNLLSAVEFCDEYARSRRPGFLQSLTVMSVPAPCPEALGMFMLEAMASGVPVVQPRLGAFPEIIRATGGGVCYEPGDVAGLADALEDVLLDESKWRALSRSGRDGVRARFDAGVTAAIMAGLYKGALEL
ncbi:MAG: glycosyltransferase family 4 protein [bacterium]